MSEHDSGGNDGVSGPVTAYSSHPAPSPGALAEYPSGAVGFPGMDGPGPVDFESVPVRISSRPLPRGTNPGYRHLRAQESATSAATKRNQLNILATMLGAPVPPKIEVAEDRRKNDKRQFYPYDFVHWEDLRADMVGELLAELRDKGLSPATRNAYRSLLRGVAHEAWQIGLMSRDDVEKIRNVKGAKNERLPGGKAQPEAVIRALLDVCDQTDDARSCRDGALIALMATTGLRRAEVGKIQVADIDFSTRDIRIQGKGNKERVARVPEGVWERITDYIQRWRTDKPGALFTAVWRKQNKPRITEKGLSPHSINSLLDRIRRQAQGESGFTIAPHDLRRTFATDLFEAGISLRQLQILLGHASMATTERYVFDKSSEYRELASQVNADRFKK